MEVGVEAQVGIRPLHHGDRAALSLLTVRADDAEVAQTATVEAEHRVDEHSAHRAEQGCR